MRLLVFGASGKCGAHFVRLAAAGDHDVTAVVRAETAYEPPAGVSVLKGDVLDAAFVAAATDGCDAVASGLGMRYRHPWAKRESPDDFTSRATSNIIAAMVARGVRRLSLISAAGVGDSRPGLNLPMRALLAVSNVGKAYADMERVEAVLRQSDRDWQAVRPVTLSDRPPRGEVRVLPRYPASAMISREAVAGFMLRELERPSFSQRTPIISDG
jgi:nucleoside-diphosphate-sugar epimerase